MITFPLQFILVLIATFLISLILTPFVRLLAFKIDAVDYPNARRINKKPMPSAGGLAILLAFTIATVVLLPMITKGYAILEVNGFIINAILLIQLHQFFNDNTTEGIRFLSILKLGFITQFFRKI